MNYTIHNADAISGLRQLEAESVQTVFTSPPYFGLRSYGTDPVVWGEADCEPCYWKPAPQQNTKLGIQGNTNGIYTADRSNKGKLYATSEAAPSGSICERCNSWKGELGGEPTVDRFVDNLVSVFSEVWRVLRKDGTVWLNIGDSYAGSGRGAGTTRRGDIQRSSTGTLGLQPDRDKTVRAKNLYGVPWRLALALQSYGWIIRNDLIWHKPNPMPESVKDRLTRSHEHVFLLVKSSRTLFWKHDDGRIVYEEPEPDIQTYEAEDDHGNPVTVKRNRWSGRHYYYDGDAIRDYGKSESRKGSKTGANARDVWTLPPSSYKGAHFATFPETLVERCILASSRTNDLVLDPFTGSGTTGAVALQLGRRFVGIELKSEYVELATKRINEAKEQPTFLRFF